MPSFEERYYRESSSAAERIGRDARLLVSLLGALIAWATTGWRLRRAYRKARHNGNKLYLDDVFPADKP